MQALHRYNRCLGTDYLLLIFCLTAAGYGLLLVSSATDGNCLIQALCLAFGAAAAYALSLVPAHLYKRWCPLAAAVTLILLFLTFTPLGYTVPGTDDRNWLQIPLGSRYFLFQPSELLKIVFILTFSRHLAAVQHKINRPLTLLLLFLHGIFPTMLVFFQGDDGNAAVFLLLFYFLLFAAGADRRLMLLLTALAAVSVPIIWKFLDSEKQARFLCLIRVEEYRNTTGWQQDLALTSIGSGQLFGIGYGKGSDSQLYARNNDFIFTVAGEEFGFIGALAVLVLLLLILYRLYRDSRTCPDAFGQSVCFGILVLIAVQTVINVGMTLRLMPVLGITLPFFSAGGSSLLTLFAGIGMVLSVSRRPRCSAVSLQRKQGKIN